MRRKSIDLIRRVSAVVLCLLLLLIPISKMVAFQGRGAASPDELAQRLEESLRERKNHIVERYAGSVSELFDQLHHLIPLSIGQDDYLRYNLESWSISASGYPGDVNVEICAEYLTNSDQEAQLSASLLEALPLLLEGKNTLECKIRAIHDEVCEKLAYDESLEFHSAYAGWVDGRTVCQGYALLLQRMFDMTGIPSRILCGQLNGSAHAWNLVLVDGKWLHLDATNNDASQTDRFYLVGDEVMASAGFLFDAGVRARLIGENVNEMQKVVHLFPKEGWHCSMSKGRWECLGEHVFFALSGGSRHVRGSGHAYGVQATPAKVFVRERKRWHVPP